MKDAILGLIEGIAASLQALGSGGVSSYLTAGIGAFPAAYSACQSVANNICKPVAYTLLTIFMMIDLYQTIMQLSQQGGGGMAATSSIIKSAMKYAVVKWAIDFSSSILSAIFSVSVSVTSAIGTTLNVSMDASIAALKAQVDQMTGGPVSNLGSFLIVAIAYFFAWIATIGINVVILSRFVQVYVFVALAPIPFATFPEQHASQIGISFLRGFASVCLQAAVIAIACRLFPLFASTISPTDQTLLGYCLQIGILCLVLLSSVFSSSQVAKSVFGAA